MDAIDTGQLLVITFVIGITAEAITAALAAGKQKMDLFGVVALAALTGLGGGTIRDMILDTYPLTWVENPIYLVIVVVAALVTVSLSFLMHYFRKVFLLADAVGLATFSVIGTQIALDLGYGFVIAAVAAVVNGVSGGVLRDLMSDRVPLVFSKELYASVAMMATAIYMGLLAVGLSENWTIVITLVATFTIRVIAMYFGLSLPVFDYRGADQPIDPRASLSYQSMRRHLRLSRRRVTFDTSRYTLLGRSHNKKGKGRKQRWALPEDATGEDPDEMPDPGDGAASPSPRS
ncbi:trimeric intracellular cation channel family protein [Corynebacterium hylobatis]|uniref:Trimeric intracellular cation channel family protein n=1 Tax=Corynebacterium hylobatis TaxID=1859290 RepID=A0A3S0A070_9CORY|nr:trimeric intracellular cation channel family protein [Corynebacterium hylobatis]RSZ64191.1 trimeric intracellular cation channel family protein [Corynebacterium hylobatis]